MHVHVVGEKEEESHEHLSSPPVKFVTGSNHMPHNERFPCVLPLKRSTGVALVTNKDEKYMCCVN